MNDVQLCYFAALIDGLRLINEKAQEKHIETVKLDADALIHYVRFKGDQLVALLPKAPSEELFNAIPPPSREVDYYPEIESVPFVDKPRKYDIDKIKLSERFFEKLAAAAV